MNKEMIIFGSIFAVLMIASIIIPPLLIKVYGEDRSYYGKDGMVRQRIDGKPFSKDGKDSVEHVDVHVRLDRLQVAVSQKKRLDSITNFSKWIVGFSAFVIANKAIQDQRRFRAFRDYNFKWNAGFVFLYFTFVLFLFCAALSSTLSQQIELGHISKYCPFFTWFLQVLNLFGVISFLHATTLFQETFHWSKGYRYMPRYMSYVFIAVYGLFWLILTLTSVRIFDESKILANSREFGKLNKDGTWTSSWGANFMNLFMPYRDQELYEHFVCKPLSDNPRGSKAKPSHTISVPLPSADENPLAIVRNEGDGETLLAVAQKNGHSDVVALLEEHFGIKNKEPFPLHAAAKVGNVGAIERLLNEGKDVNEVANGHTALFIACENGQLKAVKLLLEKGADTCFLTGVVPAAVAPKEDEPEKEPSRRSR